MFERIRGEGGGIAAAVILLPLLLVLMELIVFTGRVSGTSADLNAAASEGARTASFAGGSAQVPALAERGALAVLDQRGVPCNQPRVVPSPESQLVAGGVVAIEVFCKVNISDLGFITALFPDGAATEFEMRGFAFEGIDQLRVFNE